MFGAIERSDLDDVLTWLGHAAVEQRQHRDVRDLVLGLDAVGGRRHRQPAPEDDRPGLRRQRPVRPRARRRHAGLALLVLRLGLLPLLRAGPEQPGRPRGATRCARSTPPRPARTSCEGEAAQVESAETGARDEGGYCAERNLRPLVERNYRGSVLLVQGMTDWNVRPAHAIPWTVSLREHGIRVQPAARPVAPPVPGHRGPARPLGLGRPDARLVRPRAQGRHDGRRSARPSRSRTPRASGAARDALAAAQPRRAAPDRRRHARADARRRRRRARRSRPTRAAATTTSGRAPRRTTPTTTRRCRRRSTSICVTCAAFRMPVDAGAAHRRPARGER